MSSERSLKLRAKGDRFRARLPGGWGVDVDAHVTLVTCTKRRKMASINKFHVSSCTGGTCECRWALDYRPLGMTGARRRVRFKTRKQAERFLTETAHRAAQGEYVEPAKIPTFAE